MSSYLDEKFQWYTRGIKTIKPNGFITMRQLINSIISPKPEMVEAFKLIQEAGARGDKAEKDRLKAERLFFTTPSAIFNPIRNYESIEKFTNFGIFEYDNIPHCEELRDYIFEKRKDCIFAFCSPSFTGCKFVFLFGETPTSIEHYKALWFGIAHDLDKFINLDLCNERCTQPLYNSYDPNAKFRSDAVGSSVWGYKEGGFIPHVGEIEVAENVSEEDVKKCFSLVKHIFDRIEDNAHNNLVSCSFTAGGLCSFYGINSDDMWEVIEESIRNHAYIRTNIDGYLKTSLTLFNKGLNFPTPLKKKEND
jgi:hypothetical protein